MDGGMVVIKCVEFVLCCSETLCGCITELMLQHH